MIVLGAKVKEHTVSNSLKKRLDKAIDYAQKNPKPIWCFQGERERMNP